MINIKPILLGLPSQEAVKIMIRPIIGSTQSTDCKTYYEIFSQSNNLLAIGNHAISEQEYADWGSDNAFIEDIVLKHLSIERL